MPIDTKSVRRKVVLIVALKLIVLAIIYWSFFGPGHRVKVDPAQVQTRFYSTDVQSSGAN